MPSYVLSHQSPYLALLKKKPDYSILRVFGCACYPLLHPYNNHKLMFRSVKCIFIGYSSNYRGYRCLDPSTNRVYISRHVVFDEGTFPAQDWISSSLLPTATASTTPRGNVSSNFSLHLIPPLPPFSLEFHVAPVPLTISELQAPLQLTDIPTNSGPLSPAASPDLAFPIA
jgi:hypothetical protein